MTPFGTLVARTRITEVLLMLGFPLVGVLFTVETITVPTALHIVLFCVATFALFAAIYSFNSYGGFGQDQHNARLNNTGRGRRSDFLLLTLLFLAISLVLYTYLNWILAVMAIASFWLWWFYSRPRVGLKNYPFAGTLVHFVSQIGHFQMGVLVVGPVTSRSLLISVYFALLFAGGHLHHELVDFEADRQAGLRTGAVVLGKKASLGLYCGFFLVSGIYWLVLGRLGILAAWEVIPFLTALGLQFATLFWILSRKRGDDFLLLNRALYRTYYLIAGIGYSVLKLVRHV